MLRIEPKPMCSTGPTSFSQISSPVFAVERLDDVAGVPEIDDAVVHERHRLVRAAFVHAQTHASCRSFTLSRVISLSGL